MRIPVICLTLLVEKSPQALPLGAACIASAIKHHKLTKDICDVKLMAFTREDEDFQSHNSSTKAAADFLVSRLSSGIDFSKPVFFCFSIFVWNRVILEECAKVLQKKGAFCICGGPEVTANPAGFSYFDAVTTGEGEIKVPIAIYNLLCKKGIVAAASASLSSQQQNETQSKPQLQTSLDLSSLSSPYLDGTLNPADYGGVLWELARGCPFKCSYCYESKGEKTVRLFPMERIEKELDLFAKLKIPQVFVLDPTYNANKKRALQMLDLIAKKTPDTFYYFEARAEFIDRQMAQAFTKIPCAIQFGLQSADENVLRLVNRPFNKKLFVKNIGYLNEAGAIFGFDLIYGLPGETLRGFKDGIDFAISLYPNNLEIFCLSVLPGTDLFDRAEELKLTFEEKPPYHIIHTDKYSADDIKRASELAQACNLFYNDGKAVPWFNTICHALKTKPSDFFKRFYEFCQKKNVFPKSDTARTDSNPCHKPDEKQLEQLQIDFVTEQLKEKHQDKYIRAACDIIRFNGAISRTTENHKSETITLSYNAEYIASEYATDLQFFVANVKPKSCKMQTFIKNGQTDFRILR